MGEIHELFVLALSLVWFAGATPDWRTVVAIFWLIFGNFLPIFGNGPNTVSKSTVSNTELSEFFCPHRVLGRDLSEFLSAYYLCDKANSPSFSKNSPSLPPNSVRLSEFSSPKQCSRNSIPLPFPILIIRRSVQILWSVQCFAAHKVRGSYSATLNFVQL